MGLLRPTPLDEQIKTVRDNIEAFVDARVAELKNVSPGVPEGVLRNILTGRSGGCACEAYLWIKQKDDEAAAAKEDAA